MFSSQTGGILARLSRKLKKIQHDREVARIHHSPRYTQLSTGLLGASLVVADGVSFYYSYQEIFEKNIYAFRSATAHPYIIDCGSNIGLSILFFKRLYPQCKILSFEADPKIYPILAKNIATFNLPDVTLVNKAVWESAGVLEFSSEGADSGRLGQVSGAPQFTKVMVETVRLYDYLDTEVDFLKIDVEGAEVDLILDCAERLHQVKNLFIEYHSFSRQEQRLDELLRVVRKAGFRVQIHTQGSSSNPFLDVVPFLDMDLQLNLFCMR